MRPPGTGVPRPDPSSSAPRQASHARRRRAKSAFVSASPARTCYYLLCLIEQRQRVPRRPDPPVSASPARPMPPPRAPIALAFSLLLLFRSASLTILLYLSLPQTGAPAGATIIGDGLPPAGSDAPHVLGLVPVSKASRRTTRKPLLRPCIPYFEQEEERAPQALTATTPCAWAASSSPG